MRYRSVKKMVLMWKSGRPTALKSAMFASFMFFMQTVSLVGKDSGYFLGNALDEEEKQKWIYLKKKSDGLLCSQWVDAPSF